MKLAHNSDDEMRERPGVLIGESVVHELQSREVPATMVSSQRVEGPRWWGSMKKQRRVEVVRLE